MECQTLSCQTMVLNLRPGNFKLSERCIFNAQAERFVDTLKSALKKKLTRRKKDEDILQHFLYLYRHPPSFNNTPRKSTAELMFRKTKNYIL